MYDFLKQSTQLMEQNRPPGAFPPAVATAALKPMPLNSAGTNSNALNGWRKQL